MHRCISRVERTAIALAITMGLGATSVASAQCEPEVIGMLGVPGVPVDIEVVGNHAYIAAGGGGLQIVDVSDPTLPVLVGSAPVGSAGRLIVSGDHAYVGTIDGVEIVDVSDPTNPVVVDQVGTPDFIASIAISGDLVYAGASFAGLYIIDVSDPANASVVGTFQTGNFASGVAVSGTTVYYDDAFDMLVLDASDPANPSVVGMLGNATIEFELAGDYLYAGVPDGMAVIDITDDTAPTTIATALTGSADDVSVGGPLVYIADEGVGIAIIDVSKPQLPVVLGTFPMSSPEDLEFANGLVYVADANDGLVVVDVDTCAIGACCINDGCLVLDEETCNAVGGTYLGHNTTCADATCSAPCPTDLNGDGVVDTADLLMFLTSWGACP